MRGKLKHDEVGEGFRKTWLRYIKDPDEYIAEQVRRSGSEGQDGHHSPNKSGRYHAVPCPEWHSLLPTNDDNPNHLNPIVPPSPMPTCPPSKTSMQLPTMWHMENDFPIDDSIARYLQHFPQCFVFHQLCAKFAPTAKPS